MKMLRRLVGSVATSLVVAFAVLPAPALANSDAATVAVAATTEVTVMVPALNVRQTPSTSATRLGSLAGGAKVQATGKSEDGLWWKITYGGKDAFIYAEFAVAGGTYRAPAAATTAARPAAAATSARGRFGGFELGAHIKGTGFLDPMRDIGMTWVKVQVVMDGGAPDMRGLINEIHGKGMKILIGAVGNRGRAGDGGYHKDFARNVAELASQGADAIEIWNEPNLDREYGGSSNGQVNPENYANMLRESFGAIRSVNPNTLVIGGATAPTGYFGGNCTNAGCDDAPFVQRLAKTGAAAWMDCMGAHHNGTMIGPDQRNNAPVGTPWHHQWYFWGTLDMNYNAFGGRLPICWTELGYVTGEGIGPLPGGFSWGSSITVGNQAQWLGRAAQLSRDSGKVRMMIIWNADFREWGEDPQMGFSIFRPDGSCPACATLKAVMRR